MNAVALDIAHRTASIVLPTTIYAEPLSHGIQLRNRKKFILKQPVTAEAFQKKGLFSDDEMACWIEGKIKNPASPLPAIHILDNWQTDTAGQPLAIVHAPLTTSPHIVYRTGKRKFDFSRIVFEREAVADFLTLRNEQTAFPNFTPNKFTDIAVTIHAVLALSAQLVKLDALIQNMDTIITKEKTAVLASFVPALKYAFMGLHSRYQLSDTPPTQITRDDFRNYLMAYHEKGNSMRLDYDTASALVALIPEELLFSGRPPKDYISLCPPKEKKQ